MLKYTIFITHKAFKCSKSDESLDFGELNPHITDYFGSVAMYSESFSLNLIKSNQIWIVTILFKIKIVIPIQN